MGREYNKIAFLHGSHRPRNKKKLDGPKLAGLFELLYIQKRVFEVACKDYKRVFELRPKKRENWRE